MADIIGIWHFRRQKFDQDFIRGVLSSLSKRKPDYSNVWIDNNVAFGSNLMYSTPQSLVEKLPYFDYESGCAIVADARIDYREELAERLNLKWNNVKDLPDSNLILEAYLKWGESCCRFLYGDFAFAIWDTRKMKLILARDQIGIRPMFYINCEEYFAFSTSIMGLKQLVDVQLNIEEKYLIDSIMLQQPDKAKSPYAGILKLEPAKYLYIDSQHQINKIEYWDLKINPVFSNFNETQAIEGMKHRIFNSINERLRSEFKVGCELSGGLDSSFISAVAQSYLNNNGNYLTAFTQCLNKDQKLNYFPFRDESDYSSLISTLSNIKEHYFISAENRGIFESMERTIDRISGPYAPDYALLSDILFEKAEEKAVRVILSGFGGDEGISSSSSGHYLSLAHSKLWKLLYKDILQEKNENRLLSIFRTIQFILYSNIHYILWIAKKVFYYTGIQLDRYRYIPLHKRFKIKYQTKKSFFATKLNRPTESLRSKMYSRVLGNYVTNRVESTTINSRAYNIEYRYPFLDIKLLEYFYSLPSNLKYRSGITRYLFRSAAEGVLPDEYRWTKNKSGHTVPNVHYRIKIDEEKFRELIEESIVQNNFHYIDYERLKRILELLLSRENNRKVRFGNMIFLISMGVLILQKWQREGKIDIGIKC